MKKYIEPKMDIIKLDVADILAISYNELIGWAGFDGSDHIDDDFDYPDN